MWNWIKDKWELCVSAFVVLTVFVLGRKKQQAAEEVVEDIIEATKKEVEVVEKSATKERLKKALARKKYSETRLKLLQSKSSAESQLEKETIQRKLELLELAKEDPNEIDRILMEEFNIAKL